MFFCFLGASLILCRSFAAPVAAIHLSCFKGLPYQLDSPDPILGDMITNSPEAFDCSDKTVGWKPTGTTTDVAILESASSLDDLFRHFEQRNTFAMDLWFTPSLAVSAINKQLPLVTIGRQEDTLYTDYGCNGYDVSLSLLGSYLHISYTTSQGGCETTILTRAVENDQPNHAALTFTNTSSTVYLNGRSLSTVNLGDFMDPTMSNWNDDYGLSLFTNHAPRLFASGPALTYTGAIHAVSIHDVPISAAQAMSLSDEGPPAEQLGPDGEPVDPPSQAPSDSPTPAPTIIINPYTMAALSVPEEAILTGVIDSFGQPEFVMKDIVVDDDDGANTIYARVDIYAAFEMGGIQLDPRHANLTDFTNCGVRLGKDWTCSGNPIHANKHMTFVAKTSDITDVLTNLRYRPFLANQQDQVVVRIFYGQGGGNCLTEEENEEYNAHINVKIENRCTASQGTIYIPLPIEADTLALGEEEDDDKAESSFFFVRLFDNIAEGVKEHKSLIITASVLGAILCFVLGGICCVCRRSRAKTHDEMEDEMDGLPPGVKIVDGDEETDEFGMTILDL